MIIKINNKIISFNQVKQKINEISTKKQLDIIIEKNKDYFLQIFYEDNLFSIQIREKQYHLDYEAEKINFEIILNLINYYYTNDARVNSILTWEKTDYKFDKLKKSYFTTFYKKTDKKKLNKYRFFYFLTVLFAFISFLIPIYILKDQYFLSYFRFFSPIIFFVSGVLSLHIWNWENIDKKIKDPKNQIYNLHRHKLLLWTFFSFFLSIIIICGSFLKK
jgi:hypothetical protein